MEREALSQRFYVDLFKAFRMVLVPTLQPYWSLSYQLSTECFHSFVSETL